MEQKQIQTRSNWIEAAKGIGIALVVLGHGARHEMMEQSDLCGFLSYFIYSFHMPLYFAISGYTFGLSCHKYLDRPGLYFRRRVKALLVPMLSYAALIYLAFLLAFRIPVTAAILQNAAFTLYSPVSYLGMLLLGENPYSVHLWYLWVLFGMSAFSFLWLKAGKNSSKAYGTMGVASLVLFGISLVTALPEAIHKFLCFYAYFVLGVFLSRRQKSWELPKAVTAVCWLLLLINAPIVRGNLLKGMAWAMVLQKLILLAAVSVAVLSLLDLAKVLAHCRPLLWLGKESYGIYLLHQPLCAFLGLLLFSKLGLPVWPVFGICVILSIGIPWLAVRLLRRVKPLGKIAEVFLNIK